MIKNLFYSSHNPSHSPLCRDVFKIKTMIVVKQKCHLFINYKVTNPLLATLRLGRPGSRVARFWICKFVNNKQMTFLKIFVSQQSLFLFSKHYTMSNVTDFNPSQTNLCLKHGLDVKQNPMIHFNFHYKGNA